MPDLDAALKKVIIGVSFVTAAATVAAFVVFSKAANPPKQLESEEDKKKKKQVSTSSLSTTAEPTSLQPEVVETSKVPSTSHTEGELLKEDAMESKEVAAVASTVAPATVENESPAVKTSTRSTSGECGGQERKSWSDLVDEETKEESVVESKLASEVLKMEISEPKPVPSSSGDNRTNDSGVASPNDNAMVVAPPSTAAVAAATTASAAATAAPSRKRRVESGETAPDGGLGSSVCGEEAVQDDLKGGASKPAARATHSSNKATAASANHNVDNSTSGKHNSCDSGQGSEPDDGIRLAYHFYIPHFLCGKFIGSKGDNIRNLKAASKCSVQLRQVDENGCFKSFQRSQRERAQQLETSGDQVQVCLIEGTRTNIDHCLELIRQRFPIDQHPELTLDQINLPSNNTATNNQLVSHGESLTAAAAGTASVAATGVQPLQLGLTQGAMHEVYVSNIVSGGHIFLQQPTHPTHSSLARLEQIMSRAYSTLSVPDIPHEVIEPGLVCVAKCNNYQWYRVQVVRYEASNATCDVKFVDYGGYFNFSVSDLKQIRTDFLTLPFQALECYLGNVIPPDGKEWPVESGAVLNEMVQNQIINGRMLGVNEECVPIVHLYGWVNVDNAITEHEQQPRLLNRELVDRGVALWTEHIIAN